MTDTSKPTLRLMVGAAGIVFGDIGTSPLYAFRESFTGHHPLALTQPHVLGVLSMLIWALILVVTVKYVFVTMHADNSGEGGSFALLAFVRRTAPQSRVLPLIGVAALVATALFYGDAVITPAISILSSVEGLSLISPHFTTFVIPLTLVIIVGLFALQRFGTAVVGSLFGPIMIVWFATIGVLGAIQIVAHPVVILAANPSYAISFFLGDPVGAFFTLGTVVLAVTGAEALYADMGHFGRSAISRSWLILALPALVLCYAGQSALVLGDPAAIRSPFYLMAPPWLLVPMLVLAAVATVIASQAIISGAFSVTHQATQLGYLPRLDIRYTSNESSGQIYVPAVNGMLFVVVIALVLGFRSSDALASAFGLAVTTTMVLTTLIIGYVIFHIWRWPLWWAVPLYGVLLTLDLGLWAASATKFTDGGWLPLSIAVVMVVVFDTWRRGRALLVQRIAADGTDMTTFLKSITKVHRVPACAIYLTTSRVNVPPALLHNLKANLIVHSQVLLVTVETALTPLVEDADRSQVEDLGEGFTRVHLKYGFAEHPDLPAALRIALADRKGFDPLRAGWFLSRQVLVPTKRPGMALWREKLFAMMVRMAATPMRFFRLPIGRVVELGTQVEI
jgi:KUP system potassium uptake protein